MTIQPTLCGCGHPVDDHQTGTGPWTGFCGHLEVECGCEAVSPATFSIPVMFHVQADNEAQAAEILSEALVATTLVKDAYGRQTGSIESWEMPNHRWADRSDNTYHLEIVEGV
jgi:uncharacterized lipoprotein YmbA